VLLHEIERAAIDANSLKIDRFVCDSDECKDHAVWYCTSCKANLCGDCDRIIHEKLSKHRRIDAKEKELDLECFVHKEELKVYCSTHEVMICAICLVLEHQAPCIVKTDAEFRFMLEESIQLNLLEIQRIRRKATTKFRRLNSFLSTLSGKEKDFVKAINDNADVEISKIIAKRDQAVFDLLKGFSNEKDLLENQISEYSEVLVKAEQLSSQNSVLNDLISNRSVLKSSNLTKSLVEEHRELVYVCDASNSRIMVFTLEGVFVRTWGKLGSRDGDLDEPHGIVLHDSGIAFVCDYGNHRIQVFRKDGTFVRKWGKLGDGDGEFTKPSAIAIGPSGNIYVSDEYTGRIQRFLCDGTFLSSFGKTEAAEGGNSSRIYGLAVQSDGVVYQSDYSNSKIRVFNSDGTYLRSYGTPDRFDGVFSNLLGITISDSTGEIYVCDPENRQIQIISSDEVSIKTFFKPSLHDEKYPSYIAFGSDDLVYICDDFSEILVFQRDGTFVRSFGKECRVDGKEYRLNGIALF
jgi:DNA-binding beta-propeller fold protein YncE